MYLNKPNATAHKDSWQTLSCTLETADLHIKRHLCSPAGFACNNLSGTWLWNKNADTRPGIIF